MGNDLAQKTESGSKTNSQSSLEKNKNKSEVRNLSNAQTIVKNDELS